MTYGDLTREQVDKIIDDPEAMRKLQENYDRGLQQLGDAFNEAMRKLIEREEPEPNV